MEWAVSSEQIQELSETAIDVANTEALLLENGLVLDDDLGKRDRMFFYVYNNAGILQNYSRAPQHLEQDVLSVIKGGTVPLGDVAMFEGKDAHKKDCVLLMTSSNIIVNHEIIGQVFIGKDVTALYKGIRKSTHFLAGVAFIALIVAAIIGYNLSGRVILPMQQAYERQRQFAADASHELRTPLSVVMASADLLESDPSIESPILKQVIADLKDEVKKMSKLVGDLLTIARTEGNVEKLNISTFDMGDIMGQILRNMRPLAEKKNISLNGDIPEGISYTGDSQKISQLVLILVDNAVKYTPDGGSVSVSLSELSKGGDIQFSVSDTGIGIAPEDQSKVFGRFYRVDKARSREMGGNGLGLAIAMGIINTHHGKVYIDSELGKGTTFTVELKNL